MPQRHYQELSDTTYHQRLH